MFGYFSLFKTQPKMMALGLSHTFFSGLGQTFFISLFVPFFLAEFQLSRGEWGMYYSLCTLSAAITSYWLGPWIDTWKLSHFSLLGSSILISACLLGLWSPTLAVLLFGLYLLRLGGQSLLSHIASTTMARFFKAERGKALGIINLGYPLSEALLPLLLSVIISPLGWRGGFALMAGLATFFFLPFSQYILSKLPEIQIPNQKSQTSNTDLSRAQIIRDWHFWFFVPVFIAPPFLITGFFIHQGALVDLFTEWNLKSMSIALGGFAILRGSGALLIGPLIDKYSGKQLLPFYTIPLLVGITIALFSNSILSGYALFTLAGLTAGIGGSIKSSTLAEVFGTTHLGAIRSLMGTIMVLSTAASPWLFGFILDSNRNFSHIFWGAIIFIFTCIVLSLISSQSLKPKVEL